MTIIQKYQHNTSMDNTIYIGADHAGFELKQYLIDVFKDDYDMIDCGPNSLDQEDDYPGYAREVCEKVLDDDGRGILICDTGIGMSIGANRYTEIRAAMVVTPFMAERSRLHNDANIICLGQELMSHEENENLVRIWLTTDFTQVERHIRRIQQLDKLG